MGAYVDSLLSNGETVQYEAKLHWFIYISGIIFCLTIFLLPIGLLLLLFAFISMKTSEFAVTNKRVVLKTGFIARKAFDIQLDKIEGVIVNQGIIGRMFNYGSIVVRGTGGASQPFHNIADPFAFKRMIDEAYEARKNEGKA
jgi:uncharacterized membrane protein YdbT with pleckstrin-like domain